MEKIFKKLNQAQTEAVKQTEGPVLILAGAGSGKTTTIVSRLAYLIEVLGIPASNTLTLTFTNKAAKEMRDRALNMISQNAYPPLLCTFHKFGLLFLKFNIHLINRENNFVVIDTDDKKRIIKKINSELPTPLIASEISRYKNSLMSPDEAYKQAEFFNYQQIAKVYEEYEAYLLENNLVDFDDLISITYKLLLEYPELALKTSQKYQYIMIDEYQDTNELQLKLLQKLCCAHTNLCVVGDDDQSIYGWRGANIRNIMEFDQDFSGAVTFKLEENYRSREPILKVANALIEHNRSRLGKQLISTRGTGDEVTILNSNDENEEARKIAQKIAKLLESGVNAKDIAVLYRVNVLSRSIEEGLNRAGIAYKLVGGLRFYDRAEIKDLISYLRVITNFHDDFSFKRIANKPKRGLGKASIDKLELAAHANETSIFEYLKNVPLEELEALVKKKNSKTLKDFIADIEHIAKVAEESTYEFIDVLEDTFHLKDIYKGMQDEDERVLNMDEFYGLFRDFVKNSPESSLDEFLNELTLQSEQDQVEGESIYMMSIHASKGLEFDHVFIIGLEEGFLPLVGDGSDLEEERRLGYVSFTRAKESLNLSHAGSRFYKGRRSDLQKSRFFNESGLCEGSLIVEKNTSFKKGDLVRHKIFGTGRVNGVSKSGREFKLSINFAGTKRDILASFVERL
ncbi:MAG: UvrD-helicase domain-containing protein [Epsilonproteobacteria bacterium]|nr:UvrD-helicase domain-containing protein [Campylobacterota bacterium]OIO17145.1 MAG: ATP-dependent DNA helicase [Helicobacteraceae bacterium CG1_02_36_14]PIP10116.1 MAG: ATP-dependent DNA helicase [Sulfurimonas sp. CG23_combo_of_CG06-09_8_20_14_all_36_33]PIS26565.1 MAG: ATP-dependent DNA helicase [Sulfurimonas sp. CG08_land_8_20_14_0_20_36_33]PIU34026.1 MAG: ATP-dependent DNA helicase [Sulfurimonas sp. CG07_land_8_20_14_0_80_36_56]PIV03854.1 MAG: ATP-dependent DNA helicase [Sulfurimonas sp. 